MTNKNLSKRAPPVKLGLPLIGCVHLLMDLQGSIRKLREHLGDIFTVHILGKMFTIVLSPSARRHFFNTSDQDGVNFLYGQDLIVGPFFPDRKAMREISTSPVIALSLRGQRVAQMMHRVQRVFTDVVLPQEWKLDDSSSSSPVVLNLFDAIYRSVAVTNISIFSGMDIFRRKRQEVRDSFQALDIDGVFKNPMLELSKLIIPGMKSRRQAQFRHFVALHADAIAQRRQELKEDWTCVDQDSVGDFRDALQDIIEWMTNIDIPQGNINDFNMTIFGHYLFAYYFAAQTNTYVVLSWIIVHYLHDIMHDPELKRRFDEEITGAPIIQRKGFGNSKENEPEEVNDLYEYLRNAMPLVESVIMETLRVRMANSIGFRTLTKQQTIDGKVVPAGNILVNPNYITGDQFDQPEKFMASRFMKGQRGVVSDTFGFSPFGRGRHPCTGERFVIMEIKTMLIVIFRDCHLELADSSVVERCNERAKYQAAGVMRPKEPILVRVWKKDSAEVQE